MLDYKKEGKINGSLIIEGNLILTGDLEVETKIEVTGYINCAGYSIKSGDSIKSGSWIEAGDIEAGGSIRAGDWIESRGSIKAGGIKSGCWIEVGGSIEAELGITAFLQITCKGTLNAGLRIIAGVCNWREITDEDKTITCGKLESGEITYGILKETGLNEIESKNPTEITIDGAKYRLVED